MIVRYGRKLGNQNMMKLNKIIDFQEAKYRYLIKRQRKYWGSIESKYLSTDYEVSDKCINNLPYGYICEKCEKCGRKFVNGELTEESEVSEE